MAEKTQKEMKFWQSVAQSATDWTNWFLGLSPNTKKVVK